MNKNNQIYDNSTKSCIYALFTLGLIPSILNSLQSNHEQRSWNGGERDLVLSQVYNIQIDLINQFMNLSWYILWNPLYCINQLLPNIKQIGISMNNKEMKHAIGSYRETYEELTAHLHLLSTLEFLHVLFFNCNMPNNLIFFIQFFLETIQMILKN